MNQMIEAVYENGVLRPLTALHGLTEGQKVLVALKLSAERNSSTEVSCQDAEFLQELEAEGLLDRYSWSRGPAPENGLSAADARDRGRLPRAVPVLGLPRDVLA